MNGGWTVQLPGRALALLCLAILFCDSAVAADPKIVAHRGAALESPENTLPAIDRAIALGAAVVEIDLRYSADGEVVLMHDETVDRTTHGSGHVSRMTLAEIRELDAGGKSGVQFKGTKVPTLREVIDHSRGKIQLYLDLKETDPGPVIHVVMEMKAASIVFFRPYSYRAMRQVIDADPAFRVLVDLEDWIRLPGLAPLIRKSVPAASLSSGLRNWTPEPLAEAKSLGFTTFVNVLGADDTGENLRRAIAMGFDFIQTDHQSQLTELIGSASSRR
jgi:glycerophosphoryl diester phosphodiesterase